MPTPPGEGLACCWWHLCQSGGGESGGVILDVHREQKDADPCGPGTGADAEMELLPDADTHPEPRGFNPGPLNRNLFK